MNKKSKGLLAKHRRVYESLKYTIELMEHIGYSTIALEIVLQKVIKNIERLENKINERTDKPTTL